MGCFLACFGSSKNRKQRRGSPRRQLSRGSPRRQRHGGYYGPLKSSVIIKQEIIVEPAALVAECPIVESSENIEEQLSPSLKKKVEEQLSSVGTKKKVTFDLNVRAYEGVAVEQVVYISESEDDEEGKGNKEDRIGKKWQTVVVSEDTNSNSSSSGSFPSNHRYGNCTNSDDEHEGMESGDSDLDNEEEDGDDNDCEDDDYEESERRLVEAESSESFFSLSTESRNAAIRVGEKEVNNSPLKVDSPLEQEKKTFGSYPNARDRSQYIHSVLNPVENLSQWKVVKARTQSSLPLKLQKKENINLEQEPNIPFSAEPTFKLSSFSFNPNVFQSSSPPSKEIPVDASLSTWLGSCESTPSIKSSNVSIARTGSAEVNKSPRSNSPCSEERPILGALTLEELKQFSATSSPRRSPTHSPDDMPILGTVGSYWSRTNQTTDSSSGSSCKGIPNTEDKRVNLAFNLF